MEGLLEIGAAGGGLGHAHGAQRERVHPSCYLAAAWRVCWRMERQAEDSDMHMALHMNGFTDLLSGDSMEGLVEVGGAD